MICYHQTNLHIRILLQENNVSLGYIYLHKCSKNCWEDVSVVGIPGYGKVMYNIGLNFLKDDEFFIPYRNKQINVKCTYIYNKLIVNENVYSEKINKNDPEYVYMSNEYDNCFNRKYRLIKKENLDFIKGDYKFVFNEGIKLFSKLYEYKNEVITLT